MSTTPPTTPPAMAAVGTDPPPELAFEVVVWASLESVLALSLPLLAVALELLASGFVAFRV